MSRSGGGNKPHPSLDQVENSHLAHSGAGGTREPEAAGRREPEGGGGLSRSESDSLYLLSDPTTSPHPLTPPPDPLAGWVGGGGGVYEEGAAPARGAPLRIAAAMAPRTVSEDAKLASASIPPNTKTQVCVCVCVCVSTYIYNTAHTYPPSHSSPVRTEGDIRQGAGACCSCCSSVAGVHRIAGIVPCD